MTLTHKKSQTMSKSKRMCELVSYRLQTIRINNPKLIEE